MESRRGGDRSQHGTELRMMDASDDEQKMSCCRHEYVPNKVVILTVIVQSFILCSGEMRSLL